MFAYLCVTCFPAVEYNHENEDPICLIYKCILI